MQSLTTPPGARAGRDVLVTWPDYDLGAPSLGGALRAAECNVRLHPRTGERTPADVAALVEGAVAAIVSTDPFPAEVIRASTDLRVIARVGVGVDSVDLDAATRAGVAVTITPGMNDVTVADHTLALMLAVLRKVCEHDTGIRRREWNRTGDHTPSLLSGRVVGLVGYGQIGRLVHDRLRGFGVSVLVCDPQAGHTDDAELTDLDSLLAGSDVVSLHLPLHASTTGLIGAPQLDLMRSDAILVNTARGGIVDEDALAAALRAGRLAGAGLDVFDREPPLDSPLLELPGVVASPHNAGLSHGSIAAMTASATAAVLDVLAGRTPQFLANPAVVTHARFAAPVPSDA